MHVLKCSSNGFDKNNSNNGYIGKVYNIKKNYKSMFFKTFAMYVYIFFIKDIAYKYLLLFKHSQRYFPLPLVSRKQSNFSLFYICVNMINWVDLFLL